jgi:ornithine cyclodeaminase
MSKQDTPNPVLVLSAAEVRQLLPMADCIGLIERTMRAVSRGQSNLPLRIAARIADGNNLLAVMPGYLAEPPSTGAKVIAVYPEASRRGSSSHTGVVVLFDPDRGVPVAMLNATAITALRTAAASAVATNALAREDASELAIIGTGEQASEHLSAMLQVRKFRNVCVWGRTPDNVRRFVAEQRTHIDTKIGVADSVREAVEGAHVVCAVTSSREPILQGAWVGPGTHVNLVGASTAQVREADDELVLRSAFFVDYRPSALAQAGELLDVMKSEAARHIRGEIGEVLNGTVPGRKDAGEVTVYKSLGIAAQDLAAAHFVYTRAQQLGRGTRVEL